MLVTFCIYNGITRGSLWCIMQHLKHTVSFPGSVPVCTCLYPSVPRLLSAQCFPHTTILWPDFVTDYFVTLGWWPLSFSGITLGLNYSYFKGVFIQVLCINGPYILAGLHIYHFPFHCVLLYCNLYPYISLTLVIVEYTLYIVFGCVVFCVLYISAVTL